MDSQFFRNIAYSLEIPCALAQRQQHIEARYHRAKWLQLHSKLKRKWVKLTDDNVNQPEGYRDYLTEKRQMQVKEFVYRCGSA